MLKLVDSNGNLRGVIHRENFKVSLFRKAIQILFTLGQKHKCEDNDLMQKLVELIMNSPY